jgi:hypothetical protein
MIKHNLAITLLIICTTLVGCATIYQPPKATEPTAVIAVNNERGGFATWTQSQVEAIDNKSAGLQLMSGKLRIYPGVHTLTIKSQFNRGFFSSGPYEAFTDIRANFQAGETYIVQATVQGSKLLVWINNSAEKQVTPVSATNYRSAPQNSTIFVPIGR